MKRPSLETRIALALIAMVLMTLGVWLGLTALGTSTWVAVGLLVALTALAMWKIPGRILAPLVSLASVLDAIRAGDYAQRLRADRHGIAGDLATTMNLLSKTWSERERSQRETDALLAKLLHEIDLAIFTFDQDHRLVLANPAARDLVGVRLGSGVEARSLELDQFLVGDVTDPVQLIFPGGAGRFLVRRRPFRIEGRAHHLLVLTDAEAALGAERREAWQSLVRVLGHEINNSLSPIKSIAQTMASTLADERGVDDGRPGSEEMIESLDLIASRADALGRFVAGYAALARLPNPKPQRTRLRELAERVADMEPRCQVGLTGADIHVLVDPDQLEQALINLVRNAVDAIQEAGDEVTIRWQQQHASVEIEVVDNGPGPPDSNNLFVPFFTTKPGGSGIGLLLARRIAELHGGTLDLARRTDAEGALARLKLPGIPVLPD